MTPAAVIALALAGCPALPGGAASPPLRLPPLVPAAEVADRPARADDPAAPVAVVGVVVAHWGHQTLYVRDASGGVAVVLAAPADPPPIGSWVEAVGRPVGCGGAGRLDDARVGAAPAGAALPNDPAPLPPGHAVDPGLLARLVRVEGEVVGVAWGQGWARLTVAEGPDRELVDAYLEAGPGRPGLPPLGKGDRVAVVGVYTAGGLGLGRAGRDELLLRSAADVEVRAAGVGPADGWGPVLMLAALTAFAVGYAYVLFGRARRAAADAARQRADKARLEEQLKQAAKLEAVGRLAGGVAHDFNNLLTVINGCADLLRDEVPAGGRAAALAADIRDAGAQAAALTVQLLTFGRRHPVAPRPVDLNAVVRNTARLLGRVIGREVEVRLDPAPDLRPARADAGLISQVLFNLAVNARDAMPAGGVLTIATGPGRDPDSAHPHGWVRLAVADTGEGMPPDVQARMFEPYFTTKPPGKGTGLGLATVYGIVQTLGGRVGFESAVGRGTRFVVELPAAAAAPLPPVDVQTPLPPTVPAAAPATGRDWPVVLLVEDDEGVRHLAERLLGTRGLVVRSAGAPAEALELAARLGRVDVLLTDLSLPEMDGRELAERVRADRPGVKVVYMSGTPYIDDFGRPAAGAAGFVQKPFTPAQLAAALDEVLAGGGR